MRATTLAEASSHLNDYLGIDLPKYLIFANPKTLTDFSVIGSLVVVYRYAEALGKPLVVHHMTTGGHKSHHFGTELDFDLNSPRKKPVPQAHVVSDLLRIRQALQPELDAFRIGIYFDYFWNTEAETFEEYTRLYGSGRTAASMHLGVRYRWSQEEYRGRPLPPDAGDFVVWGRGSEGYGKSALWTRRFRSWDIGFLKNGAEHLARHVIATDFRALDNNPPPVPAGGTSA